MSVGASFTLMTVNWNVVFTLSPEPSVAVTETSIFPTLSLLGVPVKRLLTGSKLSQLLPL